MRDASVRLAPRRSQQVHMADQQVAASIAQRHRKEVRAAANAITPIPHHP